MTGRRGRKGRLSCTPRSAPSGRGGGVNVPVVDLIHTIKFDHYIGEYKDVVFSLRAILEAFNPEEAVGFLGEYFGVVISKGSSEEKRLIAILSKLDAYLCAFDNKKLYELGKDDATHKRIFSGSTLVGFDESYPDTMLNTVKVGYHAFRKAVDKVINEHRENPPPSQEVMSGWQILIVILMVVLCEGARFHPIFDYFLDLWTRRDSDSKLPKGMITFIKNWSHMSSVARGEKPDNMIIPPTVIDLHNDDQAKELKDSRLGAVKVVAFKHRGKKKEGGEGTSQDCRFGKEALILSSLHHPNVVSFYGLVHG